MQLKIGTRAFAPRWFTSVITLVMLVGLIDLGRWQLHRADEKRALFAAFTAGSDSTRTVTAGAPALPRYQHIETAGHYDPDHQILLDSMVARGQAGLFVITPFMLDGGQWLLVNRGWIPSTGPDQRPEVAVGGEQRTLRGRTDLLPRPGIRLGDPIALKPPFPIVANYPTFAQINAVLQRTAWSAAAELVLLDPGEPQGYLRDWQAPGFGPERHIAYAVQWFGLAGALAVIYAITNLRA